MDNAIGTPDGWAHRQAEQAAGFDAIGPRYDEVFPHKDGQLAAGEALLSRLPDQARILDVGCGTGLPTARQLTAAGCRVIGIDISATMLDLASRNVPEATFAACDAVDIGPGLGRFDAVVAFFSLLMLPRAEIGHTLRRMYEVTMPGGWLALGMVEADLDDVPLPFLGVPVRVTGFPRPVLLQVVADAGYTVEVVDARSYRPPVPEAPPETQVFIVAHR